MSTSSATSGAGSSGYDRDNWDYDSRSARSRLGCASSEHVDHIVALKEAYDSGASVWSSARKSQFANDPLNQWCLLAGLNMSKSDGDLAEWRGGSCGQRRYIAQVTVRVKQKYGLSIDTAERRAINTALAAGCSPAVASSPTITPPPVAAAGTRGVTGQIIARRLADGRTEFGFQPTAGERALPSSRFFPTDARVGRWLNSSPVRVGGGEIGRISARRLADGRIEFAFTPTGEERVLPRSRYFPSSPSINRWLRSSAIDVSD